MIRTRRSTPLLCVALAICFFAARGAGAEEKKDVLKITALHPVAVAPGATSTVQVIGFKLDPSSVIVGDGALHPTTQPTTQAATQPTTQPTTAPAAEGLQVSIKSRGKVGIPRGMEPFQAGDEVIEIEVKIPSDYAGGELPLAVVAPDGQSATANLMILPAEKFLDEKEPNNGFRDAQPAPLNKWVRGVIGSDGDVDVFSIEGKAGQILKAEVLARRRHSLLDSLLTLYDGHGNIVAENDDANGPDSLIRFPLPADGVYYLALTDANNRGSPAFAYLLSVKLENH